MKTIIKPLIAFFLLFLLFIGILYLASDKVKAQTRDSIVTLLVTHDSSFVSKVSVSHDSSFVIKVNVPTSDLLGFYVAYDAFVLGDQLSENSFLLRMKLLGVNMLNYYARAKLYSASDRDKIAAWVKKAKEQYGMVLITIDARTDPREYPAWVAYYAKYGNTISMIEPLTEYEPYRLNSAGIYPYADMFTLLQKMDALTKLYGGKVNWYEGWIGLNYSNPQAAVDSMVLHCGRIFVSNYVSMSRYASSVWDGSMTNRIGYGASTYGGITTACKKLNKPIDIVEIQSIESIFTLLLYSCPASTTKKCKPFFGQTFETTKAKYNLVSSAETLQWTNLVGKTIFYTTLLSQTGQ